MDRFTQSFSEQSKPNVQAMQDLNQSVAVRIPRALHPDLCMWSGEYDQSILAGTVTGTFGSTYTIPAGRYFVGNVCFGYDQASTNSFTYLTINGGSAYAFSQIGSGANVSAHYTVPMILQAGDSVKATQNTTTDTTYFNLTGIFYDLTKKHSSSIGILATKVATTGATVDTIYTCPANKVAFVNAYFIGEQPQNLQMAIGINVGITNSNATDHYSGVGLVGSNSGTQLWQSLGVLQPKKLILYPGDVLKGVSYAAGLFMVAGEEVDLTLLGV